jgi:Carboxypeptidase regulatory-like domain
MRTRNLTLLIFAAALLAEPSFAQQNGDSSPCMVEYENHNQIDYGPLIVQDVKGTITDPQQGAVPKVCVGLFTENDHKLLASTESDADGRFSLQSVPAGRYRLVVKADPLCAANVPLKVVKQQKKKQILRVHMKPRGLDSCSFADLGTESAASSGKSSEVETGTPWTRKPAICISDPVAGLHVTTIHLRRM